MSTPPTFRQIRAVQKVLYADTRWRKLQGALVTIDGTMHISGHERLKCEHCQPFYDYAEGARQCDYVAELLLDIRRDLVAVPFHATDKKTLRNALAADAATWHARGSAWRAVARGAQDVNTLARGISKHYRASIEAYVRVQEYLR